MYSPGAQIYGTGCVSPIQYSRVQHSEVQVYRTGYLSPVEGEADADPGALEVEDSDQGAGGGAEHVGQAVEEPAHDDVTVSDHRADL